MKDAPYNAGMVSSVSGAISRLKALDVITNNMANANTTGYKRNVPNFQARLIQAQGGSGGTITTTRLEGSRSDNRQGELKITGNPFDVGINGDGYFKIETPTGESYSRQGNFSRNNEGQLVTSAGHVVLGAGGPIEISGGGTVEINEEGGVLLDGSEVGRLQLYEFEEGTELEKRGDGLVAPPEGVTPTVVVNPKFLQGAIEAGNVNMLREMALMVTYERDFETFQKMIKAYGDMATKASEIGAF